VEVEHLSTCAILAVPSAHNLKAFRFVLAVNGLPIPKNLALVHLSDILAGAPNSAHKQLHPWLVDIVAQKEACQMMAGEILSAVEDKVGMRIILIVV